MGVADTSEPTSVKVSDLTDAQSRALARLAEGGKLDEAAKDAGVAVRTLYGWRAVSEEFRQAVDAARATGKATRVMVARDVVWNKAQRGDLKAAIYIIEHDDPTPETVNVNHSGRIVREIVRPGVADTDG